jgi:hypothetical protein
MRITIHEKIFHNNNNNNWISLIGLTTFTALHCIHSFNFSQTIQYNRKNIQRNIKTKNNTVPYPDYRRIKSTQRQWYIYPLAEEYCIIIQHMCVILQRFDNQIDLIHQTKSNSMWATWDTNAQNNSTILNRNKWIPIRFEYSWRNEREKNLQFITSLTDGEILNPCIHSTIRTWSIQNDSFLMKS